MHPKVAESLLYLSLTSDDIKQDIHTYNDNLLCFVVTTAEK